MATSGNLEEVIKIVKKVIVYGEDKVDDLKENLKTNKNDRVEVKVVARETRAIGALVVDQRERFKSLQETPNKKLLWVL